MYSGRKRPFHSGSSGLARRKISPESPLSPWSFLSGCAKNAFPAGSDWDRDWQAISALGMTETEVSLILSGTDEREMLGVTNMAMGIAVNQLIEREGPVFFASVAGIAARILSQKGIPPA